MSYVVLGLGRTGLASVRFLKEKGEKVVVADTRKAPPNLKIFQQRFPEIDLFVGELPKEHLLAAKAVISPPGLARFDPVFEELAHRNIPIWGDIELFAQYAQAPILGITGANGKSTVTSIVGAMAKTNGVTGHVGGNIGVPALDLLCLKQPDLYILELSSFQLETTYSLKPSVAGILNITPDHLDRHGSFEHYVAAKHRIYQEAQQGVYNRHDENSHPKSFHGKTITFGLDSPKEGHFGLIEHQGNTWLALGTKRCLPVSELKLFGQHNVLNALAALSFGHACGFEQEAMNQALVQFTDLKHRCQVVKEINHVLWINDSKGTNVGATEAALRSVAHSIEGDIVLIAGGKAKDKDFSKLLPIIKQRVSKVCLIGVDAPLLEQAFSPFVTCETFDSLEEAVQNAASVAKPKDAVLLSPACTSLDVYSSFEERGEDFLQAVHQL